MWLSDPSPLTHSWPLFDCRQRLDMGVLSDDDGFAPGSGGAPASAATGIGHWSCDLTTDALTWSDDVYDLFGLPRGAALDRDHIVASYAEPSRAVMERLRRHAIRHRRGFTMDAQIHPVGTRSRWMRLVAWPECVDGKPVRLRGMKRAIVLPAR